MKGQSYECTGSPELSVKGWNCLLKWNAIKIIYVLFLILFCLWWYFYLVRIDLVNWKKQISLNIFIQINLYTRITFHVIAHSTLKYYLTYKTAGLYTTVSIDNLSLNVNRKKIRIQHRTFSSQNATRTRKSRRQQIYVFRYTLPCKNCHI